MMLQVKASQLFAPVSEEYVHFIPSNSPDPSLASRSEQYLQCYK